MTIFFLFLSLSVKSQTVSVADFLGDRQAAVSLTFDDGIQEHYTLVAPHLNRYALRGTFGINGKFMGDIDDHFAPRLTWEECRRMVADGQAEALEFIVRAESQFLDVPLKALKLKDSVLVASIIRRGKCRVPSGNDAIELGDRVVVVTPHHAMHELKHILK